LAPITTATNTAESAYLTAQIGTGTYQVKVIGDAPTAYLLSGKLTPGVLLPDYLEPNDSFEHATSVQFVAPVKFGISLYRRCWWLIRDTGCSVRDLGRVAGQCAGAAAFFPPPAAESGV
jgi:hypothetical protein